MFKTCLLIAVTLGSIAFAQQSNQKHAGVLSPVPIFPQNGQFPTSLAGQYVFFDPAGHDLVLYYPVNASSDAQQARTKVLIHLGNQFEPLVSVEFKPKSAGLIDYCYTVSSGAKSKDRFVVNEDFSLADRDT